MKRRQILLANGHLCGHPNLILKELKANQHHITQVLHRKIQQIIEEVDTFMIGISNENRINKSCYVIMFSYKILYFIR